MSAQRNSKFKVTDDLSCWVPRIHYSICEKVTCHEAFDVISYFGHYSPICVIIHSVYILRKIRTPPVGITLIIPGCW